MSLMIGLISTFAGWISAGLLFNLTGGKALIPALIVGIAVGILAWKLLRKINGIGSPSVAAPADSAAQDAVKISDQPARVSAFPDAHPLERPAVDGSRAHRRIETLARLRYEAVAELARAEGLDLPADEIGARAAILTESEAAVADGADDPRLAADLRAAALLLRSRTLADF